MCLHALLHIVHRLCFYRQWLPVTKVQLLGESKEKDQMFISKSGQSKASVIKAYDRSTDHLKQVNRWPQTSTRASSGDIFFPNLRHFSLASEGQDFPDRIDSLSEYKADDES